MASQQNASSSSVQGSPSDASVPALLVPPCAVCAQQEFRWLFTKNARHFWKCGNCGMQQQFLLPVPSELQALYDQSYDAGLYREFTCATTMKQQTAAYRYRAIRADCNPERWLDVGCADGVFMDELRSHGTESTGIDISEIAVAKAVGRGVRAICTSLEDHRPTRPYTTITGFDVLEHTLDPHLFMSSVHRHLEIGGTLVLSVPNLNSLSRRMMGRQWYFYIPDEHLFYFTPRSLKLLLKRHGFEVLSCRPFAKPLTFDYSLTQFEVYNPWIYRSLKLWSRWLPDRVRTMCLPIPIGEMLVIARLRSTQATL